MSFLLNQFLTFAVCFCFEISGLAGIDTGMIFQPGIKNNLTAKGSICSVFKCSNPVSDGKLFCSDHNCISEKCLLIRTNGDSAYCVVHAIENEKLQETGDKSGKCNAPDCPYDSLRNSTYCYYHQCVELGCHNRREEKSYYCTIHDPYSKENLDEDDWYDVYDYHFAEDFADDWEDMFEDWDEAYDYWEEHHE